MKSLRWLHISDLHFGYNPYIVETMREKMISYVREIGHIDYLFITGDLRYGKSEKTNYPESTIKFISNLQNALNIDKSATFLVQGNHDVNRNTELTTLVNQAKNQYKTSNGEISSETLKYIQRQRKPFLKLYKEICNRDEPSIHYNIETEFFNIIHINSAIMSSKNGEDGELILGTQLLKAMTKNININKPSIVLSHHYIDSLTTDEQRALEIVLKENNAILFLCGHKHVALNSNIKTFRQDKDLWAYLCGTNMDQDPQLELIDMDFFVGEIDINSFHGFIQAYKWSKKNVAWISDGEFSFPQNGALDGKHFFPPNTRPLTPKYNYTNILDLYHKYIQFECNEIQLNGLPVDMDVGQRKFELEKLFIPLSFKEIKLISNIDESQPFNKLHNITTQEISLNNIIPSSEQFYISILSGPGTGKTTLLKWIASVYCFPHKYTKKNTYLPQRNLFPIWVKCRDINYSTRPTILDIISSIAHRAELITDVNSKSDFIKLIHNHIQNGTALLLIDGLDEINNDSERIHFCNQLNTFINSNPQTNIIITSRIAGFQSISGNMFNSFINYEILPFTDSDIQKLCVEWYKLAVGDRDDIKKIAENLAENITKHKNIKMLASNPLMLTTLLLVERRVGRLPTKRVSLYSEAIQVLLETWKLDAHDPIDLDEARYQLAYVAYQMMIEQKQTITRGDLIQLLISARKELAGLISNTDSYAEFIKKVERRSALLIQKGYQVNKESGKTEAIYEFQHLTFQEYLAAYAIAQKCYPNAQRSDEPFNILQPYLTNEYMKEVILLSSVLLDRWSVEGLSNTIIKIINDSDSSYKDREYLRSLLLQIVSDEAPLTSDIRKNIYNFCFCKGMRHRDINIIKNILASKYSNEFIKFLQQLENTYKIPIPLYTSTVKVLASENSIDYKYHINNLKSTNLELVLDSMLILDSLLWIDRKKVLETLDNNQVNDLKEDLFDFSEHNDCKIKKSAFSSLRMLSMLENEDISRYFDSFICYINETNSIPPIYECIDYKYDVIDLSINNLTSSGVEAIKNKIDSIEITTINDYKEALTLFLILLLFSNEDWSIIYNKLIKYNTTIMKNCGHNWVSFKNNNEQFIKTLQLIISKNKLITSEKIELTKTYILQIKKEWDILFNKKYEFMNTAYEEGNSSFLSNLSNLELDEMIKKIDQEIEELERLEKLKSKMNNVDYKD